jgi:hypothetical protein
MKVQAGAYCKTVGSAYVGSNPTPATSSKNGPPAAETPPGGPFPSRHGMYQAVSPWVGVAQWLRTYGVQRTAGRSGAQNRSFWLTVTNIWLHVGAMSVSVVQRSRVWPTHGPRVAAMIVALAAVRRQPIRGLERRSQPGCGRRAGRPGEPSRFQDHPDLQGHQPDPAHGHGQPAPEGLTLGRYLGFSNCIARIGPPDPQVWRPGLVSDLPGWCRYFPSFPGRVLNRC